MVKIRIAAFALILALMSVLVVQPAGPTHAQSTTNSVNTVQTITGTSTSGLPVVGTFTLTGFQVINGVLNAVGTISNVTAGGVAVPGTQNVTIPVTGASTTGSCQILHLDLGPISLNLLGLQVTTNEIVLDITAQSGPGNLLGNLLCGVAHLLDNSSASSQVINQIAALLNGLLASL